MEMWTEDSLEVAGIAGPSQTRRGPALQGLEKTPGKRHTKFRPGSYEKGTEDVPGQLTRNVLRRLNMSVRIRLWLCSRNPGSVTYFPLVSVNTFWTRTSLHTY